MGLRPLLGLLRKPLTAASLRNDRQIWISVRQSQSCDLPLKSATFKREAAGKWPVSLVVEFDLPDLPKPAIEPETAIGIDSGERFATDPDGSGPENPRSFRKVECKINHARRRLSRRKKGSATQAKARRALAREYEKIANGRADFAHKFSASVVKENSTIVCETLGLKGMSKTKPAKSVHDAAHRDTFRQIEYKASFPFTVNTTFTIFRAPRGRAHASQL